MTVEAVQKLTNDLIMALTDLISEAKSMIHEGEVQRATIREEQKRLDERMTKVQSLEAGIDEEKRYLVQVKKEQAAKDAEQLTFTAKRQEIAELEKALEAKKVTDAKEDEVRAQKLAYIDNRIAVLDEKLKEVQTIEDRRIALAMRENDLTKREEADVERKKLLDLRDQKLTLREARIQKYADLK